MKSCFKLRSTIWNDLFFEKRKDLSDKLPEVSVCIRFFITKRLNGRFSPSQSVISGLSHQLFRPFTHIPPSAVLVVFASGSPCLPPARYRSRRGRSTSSLAATWPSRSGTSSRPQRPTLFTWTRRTSHCRKRLTPSGLRRLVTWKAVGLMRAGHVVP